MPFILTEDRIFGATDPETAARMVIDSGPEIELLTVKFSSPTLSLVTAIVIRPKFPDRRIVSNDPTNPRVMISAGDLNRAFRSQNMRDIEHNTRLVEYLIRMIAFINKKWPLAPAPFLWSDYEKFKPGTALYRMPSDDELLTISVRPEEEPPASGFPLARE